MARRDADNPPVAAAETSNLAFYRAHVVREGFGSLVAQCGLGQRAAFRAVPDERSNERRHLLGVLNAVASHTIPTSHPLPVTTTAHALYLFLLAHMTRVATTPGFFSLTRGKPGAGDGERNCGTRDHEVRSWASKGAKFARRGPLSDVAPFGVFWPPSGKTHSDPPSMSGRCRARIPSSVFAQFKVRSAMPLALAACHTWL